jgi:hypothetical protein
MLSLSHTIFNEQGQLEVELSHLGVKEVTLQKKLFTLSSPPLSSHLQRAVLIGGKWYSAFQQPHYGIVAAKLKAKYGRMAL